MNGNLIVITGPSGVGKGSLVKKLLANSSKYALSISATTRKIREGEENGKDYFFISEKDFDHLIQKNGFLEWAQFA
ncbi:MAG: guanylate kinase, partial [Candidatus Nanopelagicales bacterium]